MIPNIGQLIFLVFLFLAESRPSVIISSILLNNFPGNYAENNNYLGATVLFLSTISFWKLRKNKFIKFLFIASVVFFILSLGMHLNVYGYRTFIPLPYLLIKKIIPGFSISEIPERFTLMVIFCLSILSAYGLKFLFDRIKTKKYKLITSSIIILTIIFEFNTIPFTTSKFEISPFYEKIANENEDQAIIDLHNNPNQILYYQTIHHKKIIAGYISRKTTFSENFIKNTPVISDILFNKDIENESLELFNNKNITPQIANKQLKNYNIEYIIVPLEIKNTSVNWLVSKNIINNIYKDNSIKVYQVN